MRISDWSSDVCSSDLGHQAVLASNTSSIPITRLAQAAPDPKRFIGVHFFNPVPVMGLIEVIRGLATADETVKIVERSEEHTSELQSLMRISYAVFCLKKKKTSKITQGNENENDN